jgi:hypothetical protein
MKKPPSPPVKDSKQEANTILGPHTAALFASSVSAPAGKPDAAAAGMGRRITKRAS